MDIMIMIMITIIVIIITKAKRSSKQITKITILSLTILSGGIGAIILQ